MNYVASRDAFRSSVIMCRSNQEFNIQGTPAGTSHLFAQVSRGIDKLLWFVEAHAQAKA